MLVPFLTAREAATLAVQRRWGFRAGIRLVIWREFVANGMDAYRVGRRLRRQPRTVVRWLSDGHKLEIDQVSDLLLAISGSELTLSSHPIDEASTR